MRALGAQGLQIVRQAARSAAELEHQMTEIDRVYKLSPHEGDTTDPPPTLTAMLPAKVKRKRKPKSATAAPPVPVSTLPVFDREALRTRLEAASIRPMPGTSELLKHALRTELVFGYTEGGKLTNDAECHDLMALAPIHLKREEEQ